ncbi:MAG: polyprenyl synthetase family protein [Pseudomonadota bacterium]|nr:polyprenyl synthetase family protein [Pseudomonadota bacterium]
MDLREVLASVADDLERVDSFMRTSLESPVTLIQQLSHHIIDSGGKRLRPTVVLLAARACGYTGEDHVKLAASTEMVHTATLLHDDVIDESRMRRGKKTANEIWGNEASVLVGDYLYSRATQLISGVSRLDVVQVLSDAANDIAQGEIIQLSNKYNADLSEKDYFATIRSKTSRLFQASAEIGTLIAEAAPEVTHQVSQYGLHLGNAFQLIDDALDYNGSTDEIGKNVGDDLSDGKATIPLIHAMRHGSKEQAELIRGAIKKGDVSRLQEVIAAIESTGAIEYTSRLARDEVHKAVSHLSVLEQSKYRDAMEQLALFTIERRY